MRITKVLAWATRRLLLTAVCAPFAALTAFSQPTPPVRVVLFTHIEDNTPAGPLGSPESRQQYLALRGKLIGMADLARDHAIPWSLQPDWKILRAALLYEDATLMETTNGKNLFRYLREDLGAVIDPHSHENGGYNYTDVAHLLDSLGVGGSTVIGGHIWDPSLPQFQQWDRFRVPVQGEHYPWAWWRGDILMGSGTPNHVDDPIPSGVWRPQDRDHYWVHDSTANIVAVGQFRGEVGDALELADLYRAGIVPADVMLTSSHHIKPADIMAPGGLAAVESQVLLPMAAMRAEGIADPTDFTALVATWEEQFASRGYLYDAEAATGLPGSPGDGPSFGLYAAPNPLSTTTTIRLDLDRTTRIRLVVYDVLGREVALLADGTMAAGSHALPFDARMLPAGIYFGDASLGAPPDPIASRRRALRIVVAR